MTLWRHLADIVATHGAAALVRIHAAAGSTPREAGAAMAVRPDGAFHGTIGGGALEWEALAQARTALRDGRGPACFLERALGPDLGQCCGGRTTLAIETFDTRDLESLAELAAREAAGPLLLACRRDAQGRVARVAVSDPQKGEAGAWHERYGAQPTDLLLFGAGHVGRALVLALAPLPFRVRWVDMRADAFPTHAPANVTAVCAEDPEAEIAAAQAGTFVLVMTHAHPLDQALTAAALARDDLPFVGLIGSETKRARFVRAFRAADIPEPRIAALVCPIGIAGIAGKEPAVIAASTAAQLLAAREASR